MRKGLLLGAVLITAALTAAGCLDNRTGDVGNKNIRPNYANDYEKNGLSLNGTYSYDSPTYRTRSAIDRNNRIDQLGGPTTQRNANGTRNMAQGSFEVNERIAGQIAALPGVGEAYVAIHNQNAYVAITDERHVISPYGANVNNELRSKISKKVKAMAPNVRNVYVSTHPEAIERLQWYTLATKTGQSAQDFLPEFSQITAKRFSDVKIIR